MGSLHRQICNQHRHLQHVWFVAMTGGFQKHLFHTCFLSSFMSNNAKLRRLIASKSDISSYSNFRATPNACCSKTSHLLQTSSINTASGISTFDRTAPLLTFLKNQEENLSSLDVHELFQQIRNVCVLQGEKEARSHLEDHDVLDSLHSLNSIVLEALRQLPTRESVSFLQLLLQDKSSIGLQNVAMKLSENLIALRDRMNENEFALFVKCLQMPSSSGERFYVDLKNHVPDFDLKIMDIVQYLAEEKRLCRNIWPPLLLNLANAGVEFRLEPLPHLCQQVFQHMNQMSFDGLKTSAELISTLKKETSWYASDLLEIFRAAICEIQSPSVFTSIVCSVIDLSSSQIKEDMFDKFEVLFNPSSEHTVEDLIAMMKVSFHFESVQKLKILEKCSCLLKPLSDKMSLSQIVSFLYTCRHFYFKPDDIYNQLFNVLKENAKHLTREKDIMLAADLLSQGHTELCEDVVNKLLRILDTERRTDWSKMCSVALRVDMHHPELVLKFRERCMESLPEIQDVALLNTLARFVKLKCSPKSSAHNLLKEQFITASYRAVTPRDHSCIVSGLRKLGLTPNQIDPFVWIQMRKFLPSLAGESSRRVLSILGNFKFFHINPYDHSELFHLQRDVFHRILCKKPPKHLQLDGEEKENSSGTNEPLVPSDGSWDVHSSVTKSNVIGTSLFIHQTRMYYSDILDKIVVTVHDDVHTFTPYEIRDAVFTLASCGVSHPRLEDLCHAFAKKLVTFFDEMGPFTVVESALNLAKLQFFDAVLLRKIFVWKFLEKAEKLRLKSFMSHLLMQLNRAVCLEYPELQVPWFHHEVNMETHDWKIKWNKVKDDVYLGLCDLLGEDGVVKTGAITPYNYLVDFEFCCNIRDIVDVPSKSKKITERIAIDVLPRSSYFRNESSRLTGEIVMKRRHLEILGYRYITIPYHGWDRNLPHRSDKVNLLRKHVTEQLHLNTTEDSIFQYE